MPVVSLLLFTPVDTFWAFSLIIGNAEKSLWRITKSTSLNIINFIANSAGYYFSRIAKVIYFELTFRGGVTLRP